MKNWRWIVSQLTINGSRRDGEDDRGRWMEAGDDADDPGKADFFFGRNQNRHPRKLCGQQFREDHRDASRTYGQHSLESGKSLKQADISPIV